MDEQDQNPINPKVFRAALDGVLRRRDPAALRAFLVAQGQWTPETATDPEAAMWMMIAASPALADLRAEAERWLRAHEHAAEADAILGRAQSGGPRPGASGAPGGPRSGPRRGSPGGQRRPRPPHPR